MVLKVGIEGVVVSTGSIQITPMLAQDFNSWMILCGILINTAAPPLSAWLADAYPESSPTGSVFLSAFTTKTAVYVLARGYAGTEELVWIGGAMALFPIFYAVIENDLRRVLGCSTINQIGFNVELRMWSSVELMACTHSQQWPG